MENSVGRLRQTINDNTEAQTANIGTSSMPAMNLYHKRQKELRGEVPDVFVYDVLPRPFRIQIVHVMWEFFGDSGEYHSGNSNIERVYKEIVGILRKEFGLFRLPPASQRNVDNYLREISDFLVEEQDQERVLSAIEVICWAISVYAAGSQYYNAPGAKQKARESIDEINVRFKEHGLGYEFNDEIIKVDSQFIHAEAVRPALVLLGDPHYKGAQEEFLNAHEHYRKGAYKEAMNEALKALESVLKSICARQGWSCSSTDTVSKLIKTCFDKGLIPPFWQSHFSALRSTLETGVPTARNKLGGHGQGMMPIAVPDHVVSYVLHMTASAITFLAKAEQRGPEKKCSDRD